MCYEKNVFLLFSCEDKFYGTYGVDHAYGFRGIFSTKEKAVEMGEAFLSAVDFPVNSYYKIIEMSPDEVDDWVYFCIGRSSYIE